MFKARRNGSGSIGWIRRTPRWLRTFWSLPTICWGSSPWLTARSSRWIVTTSSIFIMIRRKQQNRYEISWCSLIRRERAKWIWMHQGDKRNLLSRLIKLRSLYLKPWRIIHLLCETCTRNWLFKARQRLTGEMSSKVTNFNLLPALVASRLKQMQVELLPKSLNSSAIPSWAWTKRTVNSICHQTTKTNCLPAGNTSTETNGQINK